MWKKTQTNCILIASNFVIHIAYSNDASKLASLHNGAKYTRGRKNLRLSTDNSLRLDVSRTAQDIYIDCMKGNMKPHTFYRTVLLLMVALLMALERLNLGGLQI